MARPSKHRLAAHRKRGQSPTTQAIERADILNIGGFSDQVCEVIAGFASGRLEPGHWVARIEAIAA